MNEKRWQEAEKLAARRYVVVIYRDFDPEEGKHYYVAVNPEIVGCMAVGETLDEARQNLNEARVDVIYFLLEDGLPVPDPRSYRVESTPNPPQFIHWKDNAEEHEPEIPDIPVSHVISLVSLDLIVAA
jgi:predicted RNase H-like HicB family nuclease